MGLSCAMVPALHKCIQSYFARGVCALDRGLGREVSMHRLPGHRFPMVKTRGESLESISCKGGRRLHNEMISWKGKREAKHFLSLDLFCVGCRLWAPCMEL